MRKGIFFSFVLAMLFCAASCDKILGDDDDGKGALTVHNGCRNTLHVQVAEKNTSAPNEFHEIKTEKYYVFNDVDPDNASLWYRVSDSQEVHYIVLENLNTYDHIYISYNEELGYHIDR